MGMATVRRWISDGGLAVVGDLNETGLAAVADEFGDAVATQRCDVTSESDQQALMQLALVKFGSIDAAVACPAAGNLAAIVNMPVEEWRSILEVTLTGVMITIKHAGRVMSDGGAIVSIASINSYMPGAGLAAYNAAKAGVVMLTKIAAVELASRHIRVNAVSPGLIATNMTKGMLQSESMLADWAENTPLERYGQADEVAALICWLLSAEASYITGEAVTIDGGTHLMRFPNFPLHSGVSLDVQ